MRLREKAFALLSVIGVCVLTVCALVSGLGAAPFIATRGEEQTYQLVFDESNRLTENSNRALTANGNVVLFNTSGLTAYDGGWQQISKNGYVRNKSPISGLKSVYYEGDVTAMRIDYGWEYNNNEVSFRTIFCGEPYDFNGEHPSFFRIINSDKNLSSINRIVITYTCNETSNPYTTDENLQKLTFTDDGSWDADKCSVKAASKSIVGDIRIPSIYRGRVVNKIDDFGFSKCTGVTSVCIPSSVNTIGYNAFDGCSSIKSVSMEEGVATIGDYAFRDCLYLESLVIPNSVSSRGFNILENCASLASLTLKMNSTRISGLFGGSALVPESLKTITVSEETESITTSAFADCTSITEVVIPNSVASIGKNAFKNCASLSTLTVPFLGESVSSSQYLGYLFGAASYSTTGVVPESLKTLIVSEGCLTIGEKAFYQCDHLETICLPKSLTSIGESAMVGCTSLSSITIPFVGGSKTSNQTLAYVCGKNTSVAHVTVLEGCTSIAAKAFQEISSLVSVTLPDGIVSIGTYAFQGCTSLLSVNIPDSVTTIGYGAFSSCYSMTDVVIPGSMEIIPDHAFAYCRGITSVYISNGVTSIGEGAFTYCTKLESIEIPDSVITLGREAFYGCEALTSAVIGKGVTSIGDRAFYGCRSLETLTLSKGLLSIGSWAFGNCTSLLAITIPDSVTSIGEKAFGGCDSIVSMTIPFVSKYLGYWFNNSTYHSSKNVPASLKTVIISDVCPSVPERAFSECSSLIVVVIGNGVTSIGKYAFLDCTHLASIRLGRNVGEIGYGAFMSCPRLREIINLSPLSITPGSEEHGQIGYYADHVLNGEYESGVSIRGDGFVVYDEDGVLSVIDYKDSSVTELSIPSDVSFIGESAFRNFKELASVLIPDSILCIGNGAFAACTSLSSVTIPDSVTSIGRDAFEGCTSLASVVIGRNVKSIGYYAFNHCSSLETITFAGTCEEWNAIEKGNWWYGDPTKYVQCSDGIVTL